VARRVLNTSIASLPQMSGGQAQMFAFTRALLQLQVLQNTPSPTLAQVDRPKIMPIILLDEVTSSLDAETERIMHNIIHEEFTEKGHTVIEITHRLHSAISYTQPEEEDMIVQLANGRIRSKSTFSEKQID
jgi:ATP-binding cassette, subfamily C (CFTR/MRP), member 1